MLNLATSGYTVDDLDWLRNEMRIVAHLELDPWGSLIVSPAEDDHETATAVMCAQANEQLDLPAGLPATFELHDLATGTITKAIGAIDLVVGGQPLRFELPAS